MILLKVLEKNIWGGLTTLLWLFILVGVVLFGLYASATLSFKQILHLTKTEYLAYAYAILVTILPFLVLIYPFALSQKIVVRGFLGYFYYPLTLVVAMVFLVIYFALLEFIHIRLLLSAGLTMQQQFDFGKLNFPIFQFYLFLPNADGVSQPFIWDGLNPLIKHSLALQEKLKWHTLTSHHLLTLIFSAHLFLTTFIKRNISQNERYQNLLSWSLGNTSVLGFTFCLIWLF